MAPLSPALVKRRHAWTGAKIPWRIDVGDDAVAALPAEHRAGWKLYHYLSGGGMRAFSGSIVREVVSRRQTRFLWFMAGVGVAWVALRFI